MLSQIWRFDPVDITQMRLLAQLPPGRRVYAMLEAQLLARGIIMGRLRRQYPNASKRDLNLKLLEEVSRETHFSALSRATFLTAVQKAAQEEADRLSKSE